LAPSSLILRGLGTNKDLGAARRPGSGVSISRRYYVQRGGASYIKNVDMMDMIRRGYLPTENI